MEAPHYQCKLVCVRISLFSSRPSAAPLATFLRPSDMSARHGTARSVVLRQVATLNSQTPLSPCSPVAHLAFLLVWSSTTSVARSHCFVDVWYVIGVHCPVCMMDSSALSSLYDGCALSSDGCAAAFGIRPVCRLSILLLSVPAPPLNVTRSPTLVVDWMGLVGWLVCMCIVCCSVLLFSVL